MKLTQRQTNERIFHNKWASSVKDEEIYFHEAFTSPSSFENNYILSHLLPLEDKTVLDLGCGLGDAAVFFAQQGARVTAIDISDGMVQQVKKFSHQKKVAKRLKVMLMPAEKLALPSGHFDIVYGNGILHHVDFLSAAKEIRRVLKTGGQGFFIEPLSYNPLINIYRRMASQVRSPDEKPLSYPDIDKFVKFFKSSSLQEFHLTSQLIFVWYYLAHRIHPNSRRYWKKIIKDGLRYSRIMTYMNKTDQTIKKYIPFLSRYFWNVVIMVKK